MLRSGGSVQVVKELWVHIKKHQLQEERHMIRCDHVFKVRADSGHDDARAASQQQPLVSCISVCHWRMCRLRC